MAETILFSIPAPTSSQEAPTEMVWYQSVDGLSWDDVPVDTVSISILPIDVLTGKYKWSSLLADATKYHMIKSRTLEGVESLSSLIIQPRSLVPQVNPLGLSLTDVDTPFQRGDSVDLLLQLDKDTADKIGDTIQVEILDIFNNVIDLVEAQRIGEIYVAEWVIPLALDKLYNRTKQTDTNDPNLFFLFDKWNITTESSMKFGFKVVKAIEIPAASNSIMQVVLNGITSTTGAKLGKNALVFSTTLLPFYCTVTEVKDLYRDILSSVDNFVIARHIHNASKIVDAQMAPNKIKRQDSFDLAVRNWVKYQAAINLITPLTQINNEEKQLDTFRIARSSSNPKHVIELLEKEAKRNALVIWAAGKDTPFVSKRFEKGIYDPNRPNVSRAELNTLGWYPWVNETAPAQIMSINGDNVEVRGFRFVSFAHVFSKYTRYDRGDAGLLAGI